jgi:hypothetical protein
MYRHAQAQGFVPCEDVGAGDEGVCDYTTIDGAKRVTLLRLDGADARRQVGIKRGVERSCSRVLWILSADKLATVLPTLASVCRLVRCGRESPAPDADLRMALGPALAEGGAPGGRKGACAFIALVRPAVQKAVARGASARSIVDAVLGAMRDAGVPAEQAASLAVELDANITACRKILFLVHIVEYTLVKAARHHVPRGQRLPARPEETRASSSSEDQLPGSDQ